MPSYATLTDVYRLALTAQAFVTRPRKLDAAAGDALDFATGTFRLIAHGLAADDVVQLVLVGTGAVPGGSAVNTPYNALPLDYYRFRISTTPNGSPLTFSDAGTGAWAIQIDPTARLLAHIAQASAQIDQDLTGESPPLEPDPHTGLFPGVIVGMVARMAARAAVTSLQIENAAYKEPVDRLFAQEKRDDEQRAAWRMGQPINPRPKDQDDPIATNAPRAGYVRRPVGWASGML